MGVRGVPLPWALKAAFVKGNQGPSTRMAGYEWQGMPTCHLKGHHAVSMCPCASSLLQPLNFSRWHAQGSPAPTSHWLRALVLSVPAAGKTKGAGLFQGTSS